MSRYIFHLYKQYCDSISKEYTCFNLFNDNDFIEWITQLNKNTEIYRNYIDSLGVELSKYSTIELDKGKYDSIGKDFATIVSPYADTMGLPNTKFIVGDDTPIILYDSKIYGIGQCNSIITHNPLGENSLTNIVLLHNMGINICLGIYGDKSDKDKQKKLKVLKKIEESITDDLEFYYDEYSTNYLACVKSNRKVKKRNLTKALTR